MPFGRYKNPKICDKDNLESVHKALQGVRLLCGDFEETREFLGGQTLVYMDPPYRALNATSAFTSYTKGDFNEDSQKRLALFFKELAECRDTFVLESNSDPKNVNEDDYFFEEQYDGFVIDRVFATRMINADSTKRGKVTELLIRNY